MESLKRLSIPALLGMLLIATVAGVASARPNARPLEQAWRVLAMGFDTCIPAADNRSWQHFPSGLECYSGPCNFVCPVNFPAAGEQAVGAVNVKRFTMYGHNNDLLHPGGIWASLYKMYPPFGSDVRMAQVETTSDSFGMQTIIDTTIAGNPVYRVQSPYIWVELSQPTVLGGTVLSGFHIHYTW